jgi:ribosome biogenesis GTPase
MFLESLGADASVFELAKPHAARGLTLARVATAERDHYRLFIEQGELGAEASGALWYGAPDPSAMPVTGDWVAARVVQPDFAIVEAVLPRRSVFARRAAGRREVMQPVAANVDLVLVVCGLDADFNLRRLERYLTLAAEARVPAAVVLNKSDLCGDVAARLSETAAVARGLPAVAVNTVSRGGIEPLRRFLAPGRTVALLGSSGVGKSAMINCLVGQARQATAPVRSSDGRGRHTTTRRELIPLDGGGVVIDTPGMRELQLWAGQGSVEQAFDDVAGAARACRFRDCTHSGEAGCAVEEAVAAGQLSAERLASYRKLSAEARRHEAMSDPLAALERKRKEKALHRRIRGITESPVGDARRFP